MKNKFALLAILIFLTIACTSKKEAQIQEIPSNSTVMCAPVTNDKEWYKSDNVAPLFEGLAILNFSNINSRSIGSEIFQSRAGFSLWFQPCGGSKVLLLCHKTRSDLCHGLLGLRFCFRT